MTTNAKTLQHNSGRPFPQNRQLSRSTVGKRNTMDAGSQLVELGAVTLLVVVSLLSILQTTTVAEDTIIHPKPPLGLPPLSIPDDNPMTLAKIELGKMLFFDPRMSKDQTLSCTSCHDPETGWTVRRATALGINDQVGPRNIPTIINAAYHRTHFWDGRAVGLEAQAPGPIENPIEMGQKLEDVVARLSKVPAYVKRFKTTYGTGVTRNGVIHALASFERTILSGNSPYDRFQQGDTKALTDQQQHGLELFEDAGCIVCHAPPLFSNGTYQNAGVGMDRAEIDEGRKNVTGRDRDLGKFRVPSLREVAKTAPYFHNGSAKTLEEAVALMAGGGKDNPNLSPILKSVRDAKLTQKDQKAIIEFLKALSGDYPFVEIPKLP